MHATVNIAGVGMARTFDSCTLEKNKRSANASDLHSHRSCAAYLLLSCHICPSTTMLMSLEAVVPLCNFGLQIDNYELLKSLDANVPERSGASSGKCECSLK